MPEVIYGVGRMQRYELQWQGISGNWWTRRYFKSRRVAIVRAWFEFGDARVIDHGENFADQSES